jgi:hypothetical protein
MEEAGHGHLMKVDRMAGASSKVVEGTEGKFGLGRRGIDVVQEVGDVEG